MHRKSDTTQELVKRGIQAKEWIESILHEPLIPKDDIHLALKDGVSLCKVIQVLSPENMKKFHDKETTSKQKYKAVENL